MTHPWRFFRAGGADQARIDTADDLLHLRDLDQKRWVALACPTRGLEFDERTLDLIDLDRDGRIRAPELIAACEWVGARLKDWQPLLRGESRLAAASLSDTEEGRALAEELRRTLTLAGQAAPAERSDIGLDEIRERQSHLVAERHNGDGIVPVAAFEDASDRALAQAIADALGAVADAGGEPGIDETRIQAFFDQAAAVQAWHAEGEADCAPADAPRPWRCRRSTTRWRTSSPAAGWRATTPASPRRSTPPNPSSSSSMRPACCRWSRDR